MSLQLIDNTYYHFGLDGRVTKLSDLALPHLVNILKIKPRSDAERRVYENELVKRAQEQEAKYSSKTKAEANSKAKEQLYKYQVVVSFTSDKDLESDVSRICLSTLLAVKDEVVLHSATFQRFAAHMNVIKEKQNKLS